MPFPWRFLLGHDSLENAQVVQRVPPEMQPITARRRAADARVVPSSVVRQTITSVAMLAATTLLIILIVVLLPFGGGFYGRGRWW